MKLFKFHRVYSWYDISNELYDPPCSGEEVTTGYGYAVSPEIFSKGDGGNSSRREGDYTSTTATLIDKLPEGATIEEGYENTLPIGLTNFVHSEVAIGTSFLNPDISGFLLGALRLTGILKISVITLAGKSLAFYQPWMAIRPTGVISPIGLVWT